MPLLARLQLGSATDAQAFLQVSRCQSTNPAPNNNLAAADTAQAHKHTGNVFPHVTHRSNAVETVELSPHKAVKPPNGIPPFKRRPPFTAATRSRQWRFLHAKPSSHQMPSPQQRGRDSGAFSTHCHTAYPPRQNTRLVVENSCADATIAPAGYNKT